MILMALLIVSMSLWIAYRELSTILLLKQKIEWFKVKVQANESLILAQNTAAELNAVDEHKVDQIPVHIEKIRTQLKPIYHTIYQWRENNESDCNSSMDKLYEFDFVGVFNKAMLAPDRQGAAKGDDKNTSSAIGN